MNSRTGFLCRMSQAQRWILMYVNPPLSHLLSSSNIPGHVIASPASTRFHFHVKPHLCLISGSQDIKPSHKHATNVAARLLVLSAFVIFAGFLSCDHLPTSLFGLVCACTLITCCWPFFPEHWPSKCQSNLRVGLLCSHCVYQNCCTLQKDS